MKTGKDRQRRNDDRRRAGAIATRPRRALLCAALVLGLAAAAAPSQAMTGGASTVAFGGAPPAGQDLTFSPYRAARATWYGPGLYGRHTACGQVLTPTTIGVAHRRLPCGTTVKFSYHGHELITQVIDRGPYAKGRSWDLTNGAREALGFEGLDTVRYSVALGYARH